VFTEGGFNAVSDLIEQRFQTGKQLLKLFRSSCIDIQKCGEISAAVASAPKKLSAARSPETFAF
jgi:hypothetical protein